ncbi:hypothetical protein [Flavobacterium branchiophilum]|nr:hypothetical protein [Flavobacterium branchiophilum]
MGAKNYEAALGRWMNVDPLAEKYFNDTPNFILNNPTNEIDPDRMDKYIIDSNGKTTLTLRENKNDILFVMDKKGKIIDTNKDGKTND